MINLTSADSLRLTTTSISPVVVTAVWSDDDWATSSRTETSIGEATTTTIVAAPSGTRRVRAISIYNTRDGAEQSVAPQRYDGTAYPLTGATLTAGERLSYESGAGWRTFDVANRVKVVGMRGASGVTAQSAMTPEVGGTFSSGDATTDTELANMRARIAELEAKLTAAGILEEAS